MKSTRSFIFSNIKTRKVTKVRTLVLGIGNTLLSDEGVGVHAVRYLQQHHGDEPDTEYLDGGTLSFTLATSIEEADRFIVIDATELKSQPGTVRTFVDEAMDDFLGNNRKMSVHEVGLLDLLHITRLAGRFPPQRALIGVQPQKLDWGDAPTDAVSAAIPRACEQALQLMKEWKP